MGPHRGLLKGETVHANLHYCGMLFFVSPHRTSTPSTYIYGSTLLLKRLGEMGNSSSGVFTCATVTTITGVFGPHGTPGSICRMA